RRLPGPHGRHPPRGLLSMRSVAILGSTGSIGTQALDVIARNEGSFDVIALAAGGADPVALAKQAAAVRPRVVAVAREGAAAPLRDALAARGVSAEVLAGPSAATEAASLGADVVLNGMTGSVGLRPTLAALE